MKVTAYHCESTVCTTSTYPGVNSCFCQCVHCRKLTNESRLSAPWRIYRFDNVANSFGWWNPTGHSRKTVMAIRPEWGLREDAKSILRDYEGEVFAQAVLSKYPCSRLIQDCNPERHCYGDKCVRTRGIYSKLSNDNAIRVNLCECSCDDCDIIGCAVGIRAPSPNSPHRKYPDKNDMKLIAERFIRE
jgi:hypothetical protein